MSFIGHIIYKYILQACGLLFIVLRVSFEDQKVLFIFMKSNLSIWSLTNHIFGVISKKVLPSQNHKSSLLCSVQEIL